MPRCPQVIAGLVMLAAATSAAAGGAEPVAVTDHARFYELRSLDPEVFGSPEFDAQLAVDIARARVSWLRQRPDHAPDFVVMFKGWAPADGVAFYQVNRNDTAGIGLSPLEETSAPWQGVVYLGAFEQYDDNLDGADGFRFVWAQEIGHRWGAYVGLDVAAPDPDILRGRAQSHWSYYLDTGWSALEGNDWVDNGDGTFSTDVGGFDTALLYSPLDLYLMGLIPASAVPSTFAIANPSGAERRASSRPEWRVDGDRDITVSGTRRDVAIDEIIALVGPRAPGFAVAQRRFRIAVLVMSQFDAPLSPAAIARADQLIDVMVDEFRANTRGLAVATIDVGAPSPATEPVVTVEVARAGTIAMLDASASADPVGGELAFVWDFGDGRGAFGVGARVEHDYAEPGRYDATVVAVDERGGAAVAAVRVRIEPAADCGCRAAPDRSGALALAMVVVAALARLRHARRWTGPGRRRNPVPLRNVARGATGRTTMTARFRGHRRRRRNPPTTRARDAR